jgi:hypothetical protein
MLITTLVPYTTPLSGKMSLTEIKQHYKLFFEACIWSRTLVPPPLIVSAGPKPEGRGVRRRSFVEVLEGGNAWLDVGDRGRDLTEYLLDRIIAPDTGRPYREEVQEITGPGHRELRNQIGTNTQEPALRRMLKYFEELRTRTDELESRLPPEGQSQWHYPSATGTNNR